jgi:Domain of unknown function (DUF4124)
MLRRISISALTLAGALTVVQADVYRWVDEKGQPHYSDQWVPGSEVIKTTAKSHGSSFDGTQSGPQPKPLTASNTAQIADQDNSRAVQQDVAKTRDTQCKAATARYTQAVQARRVYKTAANGERDYMSDADADAYREDARKEVQSACGSVPNIDFNAPPPDNSPPIEPKPIPEPKVNPAAATSE